MAVSMTRFLPDETVSFQFQGRISNVVKLPMTLPSSVLRLHFDDLFSLLFYSWLPIFIGITSLFFALSRALPVRGGVSSPHIIFDGDNYTPLFYPEYFMIVELFKDSRHPHRIAYVCSYRISATAAMDSLPSLRYSALP